MDTTEVAAAVGVTPATLRVMRTQKAGRVAGLPEPIGIAGSSPIWDTTAVRVWLAGRGVLPVVAAVGPGTVLLPEPWREWGDGPQRADTLWSITPPARHVTTGRTRRIVGARMIQPDQFAVAETVDAYRAGVPGAFERIMWLPLHSRIHAIARAGFSDADRSKAMKAWEYRRHVELAEWWWPVGDPTAEQLAAGWIAECPWPVIDGLDGGVEVETCEWRPWPVTVTGVLDGNPSVWYVPERRLVRAPAGTPVPAGWSTVLTADDLRFRPDLVPYPINRQDAAALWDRSRTER